ncbi:NAD(P)/FAD-dependent oxidoreductase [Anaeromyxobacter oryzae]|uniref:Sulfide:quinone reductase n=1 Tax=Anaeromyxobacter oryzae TaxID=2918170 RepID=A0ABM7WRY9_9BACT|nr:FAD-dependent oxidoreductase [Anaeromyxobacter oryzae]BDG02252.1 sulfide:quinone reductase [Anaeromyxobacter oryzae]
MARHVLVLGGGFAALESAIQLRKAGLDVTLVSNRPYLFVYPTSIWVATGERAFPEVCLDLGEVARRHGFAFVEGAVEAVSGARREAVVGGRTLSGDHLVVALGGERLRPKGVEHTHSLGGAPENAVRLHDALDALIAKGAGRIAMGFGGNPKDPSAVRGGPVFELMFNVDTLLRRRGVRDRFELTFFAPMASPGARMGDKAVAAIQEMFGRRGIALRAGKKIAGFAPEGVSFEDGSRLDADLVVFLPAGDGHPVVKASDLPTNEAGFVRIDGGCAVHGHENVWAIGDAAALEGPEWRAKQGHLAEVMARVAATNIAAVEAGRAERASYLPEIGITCLLDMGNGAAYVHRDAERQQLVPLPVVGHWLKQGWGAYFKLSKLRRIPRLPGM